MPDRNLLLKDLTGKDEIKGREAAVYIVDNADIELYKMLVEKSDFLFPFVRNNVLKRIENAVTKDNFINIIKFFDIYSPYYDDLFASILAKHANENLTDEIFELLEKGTTEQKSYAAKYFAYIPDTVSIEALSKYAFCDDEYLSANSAEALGQMQDDVSFDIALNNIETGDDFDKLKAVKFFCAYGRNYPFKEIFNALNNSNMPENIAGQIPYMESLLNLLESEYKENALDVVFYLISGLGEILPLSDIFQFELFEILDKLIKSCKNHSDYSSKISVILLSALSRFKMFNENDEYIFDEDKDTKYEITSIFRLLQNQDKNFWNHQCSNAILLLNETDKDILMVLPIISEFNLKEAITPLKKLINSENEIIVCQVLNTLKSLNALDGINLNVIINKIKNPNIKALIENIKNEN